MSFLFQHSPLIRLAIIRVLAALLPALALSAQANPELFESIAAGDLPQVKAIIEKNPVLINAITVMPVKEWAGMKSRDSAEPEFQGKISPLVQAVLNDRLEMVAWLLSKGAKTDYYASFESLKHPELGLWEGSALLSAVERGDPRMVKILLDGKADPGLQIRYFGGPPPPRAGETGVDHSLFGGTYFRDSRARLSALDLCLAPGFRSATLFKLIRRYAPRLKPHYYTDTLFYAALSNDRTLMDRLMDDNQMPDGATLAVLVRNGDAETLQNLSNRGMSGLPQTEAWTDTGRLTSMLDNFWFEKILGKVEKTTQLNQGDRNEFMNRVKALAGNLAAINGSLEGSRQLLQSLGYPNDRSNLNFAIRLLFEPWLQPARNPSSPALISLCYAQMVGSTLLGTWESTVGPAWKLEILPESIHNTGVDGMSKRFDAWLAPWRVAVEDGPTGPNRDGWILRIRPEDKTWLTVRLDEAGLHVFDPENKQSTLFIKK